MIVQRDEAFGNADQLGILHQRGAALGLLDLLGARQKRFQIAVFVDEKGGRLDADPRRARHVIDAVPGKGLHVHHPLRPDAEFLLHLLDADALGLHRVIHVDAVADELHQVLVGRDDRDIAARLGRLPGKGRDDVVGLVILHLKAGDVEGPRRLARQGELRAEILGRFGAVGLVLVIDCVAEGL